MYAYSHDEEVYHGSYGSPEEAAEEGILEEGGKCWVGKCVAPPPPESYFDIEDLIELVSCQDLYSGEWAEDWFKGSGVQCAEINEAVRKLIGEWFDSHALRPTFYNIEEPQQWVEDGGRVAALTASAGSQP